MLILSHQHLVDYSQFKDGQPGRVRFLLPRPLFAQD